MWTIQEYFLWLERRISNILTSDKIYKLIKNYSTWLKSVLNFIKCDDIRTRWDFKQASSTALHQKYTEQILRQEAESPSVFHT